MGGTKIWWVNIFEGSNIVGGQNLWVGILVKKYVTICVACIKFLNFCLPTFKIYEAKSEKGLAYCKTHYNPKMSRLMAECESYVSS